MTSIEEFKDYLQTEAERDLHEIEYHLKKLTFGKAEQLEAAKVDISHKLNTIYFEMLDFLTWLEQENKVVRSRNVKVLIDDVKKDIDKVRDFQEYVATLSPKDAIFRNRELFINVQQNLLTRARNLASEILNYVEELDQLEQELTNTVSLLKGVDSFLLSAPESIGKLRQKIKVLRIESFSTQKENLAVAIQALSIQVNDRFKALQKLKKVSALTRLRAALQIAEENLNKLSKTVRNTDPKVWKQSGASFEVFKEHLLQDLEGTLKVFAVAAGDLKDVQDQLAA